MKTVVILQKGLRDFFSWVFISFDSLFIKEQMMLRQKNCARPHLFSIFIDVAKVKFVGTVFFLLSNIINSES